MKRRNVRFLFTQLSAIPVFIGSIWIVALQLARFYRWHELANREVTTRDFLIILLVGLMFLTIGIVSMVAWGKILVLFGVLTKDEARGYPYAKPWERRDRIAPP